MMPTMCVELSTRAQTGAVREQRRRDERLRRAAPLIRVDVDVHRSIPVPVVSPGEPLAERSTVHTSRRSDAG
jgi:hypothetical protein